MQATIRWVKDAMFVAQAGSGHSVVLDGAGAGVRPMEMVLLGLGGCTSFDVVDILKKGRQRVTDCVAEIEAQRADAVPAVFTRIHVHFKVSGVALRESAVKRAVELSARKYCSASIMLERAGVKITHDYEIVNE